MANRLSTLVKSADRIPKSVDAKLDRENPSNHGRLSTGISVRMGLVEDMDVDDEAPLVNGIGKRKSRSSIANGTTKSYKEASSSDEEEDMPLVSLTIGIIFLLLSLCR